MSGHHFSGTLRNLRKKHKLTQRELGSKLGIGQTTIANYEQGARFPDSETLVQIADIFSVSLDELLGRDSTPDSREPMIDHNTPVQDIQKIHNDFFRFLQNGQIDSAKKLVLNYAQQNKSIHAIYSRVFEPILFEVGKLWEIGKLDVYTEHLISQTIQELMAVLKTMAPRKKGNGFKFLGIAASGEMHEIGLRMACDFLFLNGWETLFLGTYLPNQEGLKAIHSFEPQVVGISITMEYHVDSAKNLISFIRSHVSPEKLPKIIVGGQALLKVPDLWKTLGADAFVQNVDEITRTASAIIEP